MSNLIFKAARHWGMWVIPGLLSVGFIVGQAQQSNDRSFNRALTTERQMDWLKPGESLTQTIYAEQDGWYELHILTGFVEYPVQGTFLVEDLEQGAPVASGSFEVGINQNLLTLFVDSQAFSKGKSYQVELMADTTNRTSLSLQKQSGSSDGWVIALAYDQPVNSVNFWGDLAQNASQYKPAWSKWPWLWVYWIGFGGGVVWLLGWFTHFAWIEGAFNVQSKNK